MYDLITTNDENIFKKTFKTYCITLKRNFVSKLCKLRQKNR